MAIRIKCRCGAVLSAPDEHAGRRARCSKCGASLIVPSPKARGPDAQPAFPRAPRAPRGERPALSEVMRANRKLAGKMCPICQTTIKLGDEVHNCSECGQPHHLSCWAENNGCGTYGCPNAPSSEGYQGEAELTPREVRRSRLPRVGPGAHRPGIHGSATRKRWLVAVAVVLVLAAVPLIILALNRFQIQSHFDDVVTEDDRNRGIVASAHYGGWINPEVLTFDLKKVPGNRSPADVFRVFLQFARRMREKSFERVELRFRGNVKFLLPGSDFRDLGDQYSQQNPVYLVRTFPERLKNPDGSRAFPERSGGLFGVVAEQMRDFRKFHERWYVSGGSSEF